MTKDPLAQADAFDRFEGREHPDALELELLPDGRIRAEKAAARDLLRDRLRAAELLSTGPQWMVVRNCVHTNRHPEAPVEGSEVVAAGVLAPQGWTVVDIINYLASSHQSGVLSIIDESHHSAYFLNGDIVWAASTSPSDRFGAFLLSRGRITREQLHAVLRDSVNGIGRACVERGYLGQEELEPLMHSYVSERFGDLLNSEKGLWSFSRIKSFDLESSPLRLSTPGLLVESLRRIDEMRIYRQRIRNLDTIVKRNPRWSSDLLGDAREQLSSYSPELPSEAERILRALPGAASIGELMRKTARGEFEVTRTAYYLLRSNLIAIVSRPEHTLVLKGPSLDINEVVHIYGLAFSEIMSELSRTGRSRELLNTLHSFLEEEGGAYRELLSDLRLDREGNFDPASLMASVEANSATTEDLVDALGELLFFALLQTSEILGRRRGDDLARRVRLIHGMLLRTEESN